MVGRVETASVNLWGDQVGAVSWSEETRVATFEFAPEWLDRGLDLAPLKMPLAEARRGRTRFQFPQLPEAAFMGLPGLLADSLPDRYGHRLINAWLARQGRTPESFSPVERLCTIGGRGMGALEYEPALRGPLARSVTVEIGELVALAQSVLSERTGLSGELSGDHPEESADTLLDIIRVGTSAGGARPKAVIALNEATGEVRSGQVDAPQGFEQWLLKFDGIKDSGLGDPEGFGRIEYAYYLMAVAAGLSMSECRLLEENDRAHFMTRRFDRVAGDRLHQQSLCALAHLDFNDPDSHSYEQAFQVMRQLRLSYPEAEQMFRRVVFNVAARNQDDHTKNIAFLMDRSGLWRLAPAFDVTYAYNPLGRWTSRHQMSLNGRRDGFTMEDFLAVGQEMSIRKPGLIVEEVEAAVGDWTSFAEAAGVPEQQAAGIGRTHRRIID